MSAVTFVLVRHGESEWNVSGRWQGHGGTGLTRLGRRQARAVAEWVAARHPDAAVLARSDLQRVEETAAPLEMLLRAPVVVDPRLREMDVGSWAGLTYEEIRQRDPHVIEAWQRGEDVACGGGECKADLVARVRDALGDLAGRLAGHGGGTAVVVAHGGTIRAAVTALLDRDGWEWASGGVANGSVTELRCDDTGARLLSWAASAHLPDALGEPPRAGAGVPR